MMLEYAQTHGISKSILAGRHPYFEEFPELVIAMTRQVAFWQKRPLMEQQNLSGGAEFTVRFMEDELSEMQEEQRKISRGVGSVEALGKEAADVAIVSLILPAFGSVDDWNETGPWVVETIMKAMGASGLSRQEYGKKVVSVIEGKNDRNHPPYIYRGMPRGASDEAINTVYNETRGGFKPLRKLFPGGIFPVDLNTVLRLNGRSPEKFHDDPAYSLAIATLGEIDELRAALS